MTISATSRSPQEGRLTLTDVALWCSFGKFRPVRGRAARWLDWTKDFDLATTAWWSPALTRESWLSARDRGFRYCAVVEEDVVVARAAVWQYSDALWEAAAVWTREDRRGRGLAKTTVSFVTGHILVAGRIATLHTQPDNLPMLGAARSVGFVDGEPPATDGSPAKA